jgi:tRNA threonylcarbamoyladenosine biosynthesis protein TsaB
MRVLAIETSLASGTIAALDGDRLLAQSPLDPDQRTAQSFAPAIVAQLVAVGWRPQDIELLAVTIGPGSFTGLRIGITAAKTLAYAVGAKVIGVNTLLAIASQSPNEIQDLHAVIDAQRQQLFVGRFQRRILNLPHRPSFPSLVSVHDPQIIDQEDWLRSLAAPQAVTGPGLARLRSRMPNGIVVVGESAWRPQAATVGRLGYLAYQAGTRDDLWRLVPHYYRKSAAEEAWEAKQEKAS